MHRYEVPGLTIAVVRNGKIEISAAYGMASYRTNRPMTAMTPCRVESISKSVTAQGVLKLVEDGKLELDAPVSRYLKSWSFPEPSSATASITIRDLLSHNSGLPLGTIGVHYTPDEPRPSLRAALSKDARLRTQPGSGFYYSNTGFNLLELIIEEVSGQSFSSYMQSNILLPARMDHSSFVYNPEWSPPLPDGHDTTGLAIEPYVYPEKASGGLFATVDDVARFIIASSYGAPGPLAEETRRRMYTPVVSVPGLYGLVFPEYGLGYFLETLTGPGGSHTSISHGGQGSGWMTHFQAIPETGDGIVILTNSQRSWPLFSHILTDWAHWMGYRSIGMGLIAESAKYLDALIIALLTLAGLYFWKAFRSWSTGGNSRKLSIVALILGSLIASVLLYIKSLDYFFLNSIYPERAPVLGYSLLFLALAALLYGLAPFFVSSKEQLNGSNR